jgi:hypothetical protein
MEIVNGFNQDLEQFIVQGTLYVQSAISSLEQGDGSIKMSGSLYTDTITEYIKDNGININDVLFKKNLQQIIIPYHTPSNIDSASIITNGGITIKSTENSTSFTSGGGITVLGGMSVSKNVLLGDTLDMNFNKIINVGLCIQDYQAANKLYVDSKTHGNLLNYFSTGNLLYGNSSGSISGTNSIYFNENTNVFTLYNTDNNNAILNVNGKAQFQKDIDLYGVLNVFGNRIINVTTPITDTDVVNKYYVDSRTFGNLQSNFSTGSLLFGSSSGSISDTSNITLINNTLVFKNTKGNTIDSFGKILLRDTLDLTYNNIINVATPLSDTDAVNKFYVDSRTFGNLSGHFSSGSLLFGNTSGSISDTSLIYFDNKTLFLYNTTGNSLNVSGNINLNFGKITNVTSPSLDTDVANKFYVDSKKINGNFSTGQIIIGGTGGSLISNNNFFLENNILNLNNTFIIRDTTSSLIGLTSGSALTVLGGINVGGGLDVNFKRITSVHDPIEAYDAVNRKYIDALFGPQSNEYIFNQINDIQQTPSIIPSLVFDPTIFKVFIVIIYSFANGIYSLYNCRGYLTNNGWVLTITSINQKNTINFSIDQLGQFYYTNNSTSSSSFIRFRTLLVIDNTFTDYILQPSNTSVDIGNPFIYLNSELLVQKITIYVHTSDNEYSVFYITLLRKDNTWIYSGFIQGGITGINFNIRSDISAGYLQYKNTRNTPTTINFINSCIITTNNAYVILEPNTFNTNVDETFLALTNSSYFITFYVEIPNLKKYAAYDISAILINSTWNMNIQSIGDNLNMYGISFSIASVDNKSFIRYTNSGSDIAHLKYFIDSPAVSSLIVKNGGTGVDSLLPNSILRGNGIGPIITDSKLTFYKNTLMLSQESSILIRNNTDSINSSTGSLITYGGMYVGRSLIVNDIDITPGKGTLHEYIFIAENNTIIPMDITYFYFNNQFVKSFKSLVCVSVKQMNNNLVELFDIQGLYKNGMWFLYTTSNGDNTGIVFDINNSGQVLYISPNIPNWISTSISFDAKVTHNT